jgi:hypothetical protein
MAEVLCWRQTGTARHPSREPLPSAVTAILPHLLSRKMRQSPRQTEALARPAAH